MNKAAQKQRIRNLFEARPNQKINLYEILDLQPRIAAYRARISELRGKGLHIENYTEFVQGVRHSWYIYHEQPIEKGDGEQ